MALSLVPNPPDASALPDCHNYAKLSNLGKKYFVERALVVAGFAPNERNESAIAKSLGWNRNTLKGWREPRDLTRAMPDKQYQRLLDYIEMHRLLAEFGRTA